MRIFTAGITTETNTFSPLPTSIEDFVIQTIRDSPDGSMDHPCVEPSWIWQREAMARGDECVSSINAWAQPSGMTLRSTYEALRDEVLRDLREAMPVDVVLLMLHGAMVADGYQDCEEDLIRSVRLVVGPDAVVAAELDLHCHLTPSKIDAADIAITFKEYPHTDIGDRALELFNLAVAAKLGHIRPVMALFDCQMVGLYPTSRAPMCQFVDAMKQAERRKGVLSVSFGHGFQFADLPHVGAKMLVVTDNERALGEQLARDLGLQIYALRREIGFDSLSLSMDEALSRALASERIPVVVADQSDNTGGGAPGDATFALRWLLDHGAQDVAIACLYDPEAVKIAKKAGSGARLRIRLGGKLGPASGKPLDLDVTVGQMVDDYVHALPQESGSAMRFPAGDIVGLRCGTIDIVVGNERCQCFCPSIFNDLGIDPARKRLLIPKSTQHFYGAFSRIAGEILYMAGPGAVSPDPKQIHYRNLDTARLYPWSDDPLLHA